MGKYANLAKELKKNTDIMVNTFKKYNINVLQFNYRAANTFGEEDGQFEFIMEIVSIEDNDEKEDFSVKINFYDNGGNIFYTDGMYYDMSEFSGYDTFKITIFDENVLDRACSARVFASSEVM